MRVLYHYPLCPFSRAIRVSLHEKRLDYTLEKKDFWAPEFRDVNPSGRVPVFQDMNGDCVYEFYAISEYLEEAHPQQNLMGVTLQEKAETRRLIQWFHTAFFEQVGNVILHEKHFKRFLDAQKAPPNSVFIREAKKKIHYHLDYISWLVERRKWIAGAEISLADISVAAHLSTIDYFGDVPWAQHQPAKDWYARMKSRPSFRTLLEDRVVGVVSAKHYKDLDF